MKYCIINSLGGYIYEIIIGKKKYESSIHGTAGITDWYLSISDTAKSTIIHLALFDGNREVRLPEVHLDFKQKTRLKGSLYAIMRSLLCGAKGIILINPGDNAVGNIISKLTREQLCTLYGNQICKIKEIIYIGGYTIVEKYWSLNRNKI